MKSTASHRFCFVFFMEHTVYFRTWGKPSTLIRTTPFLTNTEEEKSRGGERDPRKTSPVSEVSPGWGSGCRSPVRTLSSCPSESSRPSSKLTGVRCSWRPRRCPTPCSFQSWAGNAETVCTPPSSTGPSPSQTPRTFPTSSRWRPTSGRSPAPRCQPPRSSAFWLWHVKRRESGLSSPLVDPDSTLAVDTYMGFTWAHFPSLPRRFLADGLERTCLTTKLQNLLSKPRQPRQWPT